MKYAKTHWIFVQNWTKDELMSTYTIFSKCIKLKRRFLRGFTGISWYGKEPPRTNSAELTSQTGRIQRIHDRSGFDRDVGYGQIENRSVGGVSTLKRDTYQWGPWGNSEGKLENWSLISGFSE